MPRLCRAICPGSTLPWMLFLPFTPQSWLFFIHNRSVWCYIPTWHCPPSDTFLCMQGDTIIHVLCKQGWVDATASVLKRGIDVNAVNKVGSSLTDQYELSFYIAEKRQLIPSHLLYWQYRRANARSMWPAKQAILCIRLLGNVTPQLLNIYCSTVRVTKQWIM